jgi:hypothetical protein
MFIDTKWRRRSMPVIASSRGVLYNLKLTKETAQLLRDGLETLPPERKNTVVFKDLIKNLDTILVVWDRTLKNELIVQEQRRKVNQAKKNKLPQSAPQRN